VERFKRLKKDARTIASQQVLRLETAMCAQRRWSREVFDVFLARHPLLRHLVQRIVWGAYRPLDGGSYGGQLLACFRVAQDGTLSDAADDPFTVPPGALIGIPHALDMPAEAVAEFGRLFADYELLQPFRQLGRDTYRLAPPELAVDALKRWDGVSVDSKRLRGLADKGWRRGDTGDSGFITYLAKELGQGRMIELHFTPGLLVGMSDEYPQQTLGQLHTYLSGQSGPAVKPAPFTTLDPVHVSEMVRDIDSLRG
jgi:hypothetical protein